MALQEFKCPCCGGAVSFDSTSQNMKCPYCDTEFDVEAVQAFQANLEEGPTEEEVEWQEQSSQWTGDEDLRVYICNSCGGEIITDATTAASSCPYCGNPVVMKEQLSGDLKPDYVIPFQLDKKAAIEALKQHCSGKKLIPKPFKDENHLEEIKGVYVPYWLFRSDVDADILYQATRVRTWTDTRNLYTETTHFSAERAGTMGFDHVPMDGSTKMADDLMESIEPFDASQAVEFATGYLAGYLADRYDVSSADCEDRVYQRMKASIENTFAGTVEGYNSVHAESTSVSMTNTTIHYALFPVWVLTTKYKDQNYLFAVNGQTGKVAGNLPMDKGHYNRLWALYGLIIAAVIYVGLTFLLGI